MSDLQSARKMCEKVLLVLLLVVYCPQLFVMAENGLMRQRTNSTELRQLKVMLRTVTPPSIDGRQYPFYFYNESLDEAQEKKE
jgi:hypothetical protein